MKSLFAAFAKAQAEFPGVPQDGKNPHFNSRYATLGAVQETVFPLLRKHGLLILQSVRTDITDRGPVVYVGASLVHVESSEMTTQELGIVPVKVDPQGIGSAISYGRRYLLMTMLGLTEADDDGNAASGQGAPARTQNQRPPAPQNISLRDREPTDEDFGDQSSDNAPVAANLLKTLHGTLGELYRGLKPTEIDAKRHELVKWATKGRTTSSKELTNAEAMKLLEVVGEKLREKTAAEKQPA